MKQKAVRIKRYGNCRTASNFAAASQTKNPAEFGVCASRREVLSPQEGGT